MPIRIAAPPEPPTSTRAGLPGGPPAPPAPRASDAAQARWAGWAGARAASAIPGRTGWLDATEVDRVAAGCAAGRRVGDRPRRLVAAAIALVLLAVNLAGTPLLAADGDAGSGGQASPAADDGGDAAADQSGGQALPAASGDPAASPTATPTSKPTPTPTPKPTPKPTPWPTPAGVKGVDVSHWNGYPDFELLAAQDMDFVISKATQGTKMTDDTYARHTREARAAGLLAGAYHFFDYRVGGKAQAQHFLDYVGATTGLSALLPLVVDVETLTSLGTPNPVMARSRLHGLLDELYRQTGRYPMIYTSAHMWRKVLDEPLGFGAYPLWVACWTCDDIHLPRGWSSWLFWQAGQFRFKDGPKLDGNAYAGDVRRLRRELPRPMRLEGGAAWATDADVVADIGGYDGAEVRVALDDGSWGEWRPYSAGFRLALGGQQGDRDVRLQLRSFRGVTSPVLVDGIALDSVPPDVHGPSLALDAGARVQLDGRRVPVRAAMSASDRTSGLARQVLSATCGGTTRASATRTSSVADLAIVLDRAGCRLTGRASDVAGHRTARAVDPRVSLIDLRGTNHAIRFSGSWRMLDQRHALKRSLVRTSTRGASLTIPFDGAQVAVVARRGPSGGRLEVILDGKRSGTIDLFATARDDRRIVHVANVPRGEHVLKLRATGTASSRSSGTTVWLDAVLVLDRRR